jgi:4-hydroxy-tetrahydrodipicolinate synthase
MTDVLTGVLPVVPTVFADDESLDLKGQERVIQFVADAGASAVCILANYSEQFSLDDEERRQVLATSIRAAGDRLPVIVTTSHFSARVAAARSRAAQDAGASMVMVMPPFFGATLSVAETDVRAWFGTVADAIDIPIMVQDAPMSTTSLSVDLIARLARELPLVRHAKIEVPRAAAKIARLAEAAGEHLPGLYDGEEGVTLISDLDAGALATMTSAMVPDAFASIVSAYHAGDRDTAVQQWERLLPLVHFENRQCGLNAAKVVLAEGGVIGSDRTRSPLPPLAPEVRSSLLRLAAERDPLALRWAL